MLIEIPILSGHMNVLHLQWHTRSACYWFIEQGVFYLFLVTCLIFGFYELEYYAWKVNYVISFVVLVSSANNK